MRKYIKIFGVVIFVYCCLGIFNIAKAEHNNTAGPDGPLYDTPGMMKKPVPVYCGPTEFMLKTVTEEFKNEPLVVGKVIMPQTGEVVAIVTVFVHKDEHFDMSVLMTMFNKNETCVLAYGKELDWYKDYKDEKKENNEVKPGSYNGVWQKVKLDF